MAAAVESFNFHTPSMDSALISGAEFPFGLPGTSASEFAEKSFGMDHAPDAFGFDPSFESESDPQHGFPGFHSLTPPGPLEQTFINPSAPSLPQIHTSQHMPHAQMQYGQYTPGTDVAPSGSKFPSPARDVRIKQESDESSQIASPKRKRSAASESSQAGPKRRRASRKHSEAESLDPAEGEKRNKFLERNRVAASKCRQKKKEWTQNLEVMARELQANKTQLSLLVSSLKEEVMWLKGEMLKHSDCNCHHIREYLSREAETIATGSRGDNGTGGRISPTNPNTLTGEETRDYAADWESDHRDSISDVSSTWKDGDASETIQEDPEVGTSG